MQDLYPGGLEEVELYAAVEPGESTDLFTRSGQGGRIALLQLKGVSPERHFLRKTLLRIYWDNEYQAAVNCPLGDFFGTSFGENLYCALPMGVTEQGGYCLFPMPFEEGARIEIVNQGGRTVTVRGRLALGPLPGPSNPRLVGRLRVGCDRRRPVAVDRGEDPARPEDACDLRQGALRLHPVERLGDGRHVRAVVFKSRLGALAPPVGDLGRLGARLGAPAHRVAGLDPDDSPGAAGPDPRGQARAAAQVDHEGGARPGGVPRDEVHDRGRRPRILPTLVPDTL